MLAAIVKLVGERGYAETTVAHILEEAGTSRRTFYQCFPDRQTCLMTAAEQIAATWQSSIEASVAEAIACEHEPLEAFIGAVFGQTLANPAALRLLAVELAGVRTPGREQRERLMSELGQVLCQALAHSSHAPPRKNGRGSANPSSPLPEALVGAIMRIAYARALRGGKVRAPRRGEFDRALPTIARWVADCQVDAPTPKQSRPEEAPLGGRAPGTLAARAVGDKGLELLAREAQPSRSFVVHNQRERLLDAIARLCRSDGYQAVSIPEIVGAAHVSVQTFYEHFSGRDDLLLVAFELGHRKMVSLMDQAFHGYDDWDAAVHAAAATLLGFFSSEPCFAYLALVDVPAAGGKLAGFAPDGAAAYAALLEPGLRPTRDGTSRILSELSAGAVFELCYCAIAADEADKLMSYVQLATHLSLSGLPSTGEDLYAAEAQSPR